MVTVTKEDIGKKVTFRAVRKWSGAKATRKVVGISEDGKYASVNFEGYRPFYIKQDEILEIIEGET